MPLTPEKKQFLKKISGGLRVLMSCSYKADEIATDPECPIEEFIRDNPDDFSSAGWSHDRAQPRQAVFPEY